MTFRETLSDSNKFLIGAEVVSTRGTVFEEKAEKTVTFARDLAQLPAIDWVSITDNAGGNPMLAPAVLGACVRAAGGEVVLHLSCKDYNRLGLESQLWQFASDGFHNILALSGDAPKQGVRGGGKSVFDIDSVGLLHLIRKMNEGLETGRSPSGKIRSSQPTAFFPGCVVTNFKLLEHEVIPQLLKLEKKIQEGASWIINQIGYDSRKISELIAWQSVRGFSHIPLLGNVYVLNARVARLFHEMKIPGVVVSRELLEECERQGQSPDKGRQFFLELAARQVAIYRGMGVRGVYLGGVHDAASIAQILEIEKSYSPGDWRQFAREIRYSRPDEFFVFAEDRETGLADDSRLSDQFSSSLANPSQHTRRSASYQISKLAHNLLFHEGHGLWNLGRRLTEKASDPMQGPTWLRGIEHASKTVMFGCKDCGDCSLPDIAFLCPESACAKNQRNGPCGGTRDGLCEVGDFECIWSRAYDRLKREGREQHLLDHAPVLQDQSLRGTSSWANTWQARDHLTHSKTAQTIQPSSSTTPWPLQPVFSAPGSTPVKSACPPKEKSESSAS